MCPLVLLSKWCFCGCKMITGLLKEFMMCKKSFSAATCSTFLAATKYSKCGPLQSPWRSVNIPSPSPFLSLTTRTVPLHFFCSRRATRKACVGVESSVRLTSLPLIAELPSCFIPDCPLVRWGSLSSHVCRGGDQRARPCRCRQRIYSLDLQHPSHLPCHIQGPVQEGEEERWVTERHNDYDHAMIKTMEIIVFLLSFFFYQSQRRQMSTCWAGFKGTAWGTRPSWLASMMSQMPEETRCARTPWWNLRCSMGHWGVPCMV